MAGSTGRSRRSDPARLRDVEHDSIGAAVLHLDVSVSLMTTDTERLVDVVAACRTGGPELLRDDFQALDLEADVVDAAEALAAFGARGLVVLEVEDREVDIAVAQKA